MAERGGPPVNPEPTSGFGKVVIERLTAAGPQRLFDIEFRA